MIQRRTFIRTALLLGLASPLLLTGCGLKGPLYLPKKIRSKRGGDVFPVSEYTDREERHGQADLLPTLPILLKPNYSRPATSQAAEAPSPKR